MHLGPHVTRLGAFLTCAPVFHCRGCERLPLLPRSRSDPALGPLGTRGALNSIYCRFFRLFAHRPRGGGGRTHTFWNAPCSDLHQSFPIALLPPLYTWENAGPRGGVMDPMPRPHHGEEPASDAPPPPRGPVQGGAQLSVVAGKLRGGQCGASAAE